MARARGTDLLGGNPISKGKPTGPQACLEELWQSDSRYASIRIAKPEAREKQRGTLEAQVGGGVDIGIAKAGASVSYSMADEVREIQKQLVKKNLVQWTFRGKLDTTHALMLEGVVALQIDGRMPVADPIRVFFTAAPVFEKRRHSTEYSRQLILMIDGELRQVEALLQLAEDAGDEEQAREFRKRTTDLREERTQLFKKARQRAEESPDVEYRGRARVPTPHYSAQRHAFSTASEGE
jgi:hypothetical protein